MRFVPFQKRTPELNLAEQGLLLVFFEWRTLEQRNITCHSYSLSWAVGCRSLSLCAALINETTNVTQQIFIQPNIYSRKFNNALQIFEIKWYLMFYTLSVDIKWNKYRLSKFFSESK